MKQFRFFDRYHSNTERCTNTVSRVVKILVFEKGTLKIAWVSDACKVLFMLQ